MDQRWARPWFALTALCVLAGVTISVFNSAATPELFGGSPLNRALNVFAFFTIQSNLIVGVTCLLLVVRTTWSSKVFWVFRVIGLVAITVTFVVFHVALSRLLDLDGWAQAANQLEHTIVPVLTVVGWVAFGPRRRTSADIVRLTIAFPLAYMVFTAVRGPLASDWYPYPFTDVAKLGYAQVALNALWVALLFVSLAAGAHALDSRLRSGANQGVDATTSRG